MNSSQTFETYARRIRATGLTVRGAFHVKDSDGVPQTSGMATDRTLILIGNAGSTFWSAFEKSKEFNDGLPDPLDRWSERVITALAVELKAQAVFPFKGPPYYPFQQWARRAESLPQSPMGMLVHPQYGLWHAYRGALIVDQCIKNLPPDPDSESPCLTCPDQPCLHTCPVNAFRSEGFDANRCVSHLCSPNECREQGCLARNACPAARPFRYVREQHRFHLEAFLRAQTGSC